MRMKPVWILLCLAGGCAAAPTPEQGMHLELQTTTTREKDGTHVTATLRNSGTEPANILHEFMLSRTSARLVDDLGAELRAADASAVRGARAFIKGQIHTRRLLPGETLEVAQFSLSPSLQRADAGDLSWELNDVRSKTLTLEMAYEVTEEAARTAKQHLAPDVAVGKWTSKAVVLQYRK
jgi:hypothetical protein